MRICWKKAGSATNSAGAAREHERVIVEREVERHGMSPASCWTRHRLDCISTMQLMDLSADVEDETVLVKPAHVSRGLFACMCSPTAHFSQEVSWLRRGKFVDCVLGTNDLLARLGDGRFNV